MRHAKNPLALGAALACVATAALPANAGMITPEFSQTVAANQGVNGAGQATNVGAATNDGFGAVAGSTALLSGEFGIREGGGNAIKIVNFHRFDVDASLLPQSALNDPTFSARFAIDYKDTLFAGTTSVSFGTVAAGNTWSDSVSVGSIPRHAWAASSLNQSVIISNTQSLQSNPNVDVDVPVSVDVTNTVQGWADGSIENNGFVVFVSGANNAVKYDDPRLLPAVSESLTPTDSAQVRLSGGPGTNVGMFGVGQPAEADFALRERDTVSPNDDLKIATFHQFDVSGLTPEQVNSEVFSAEFAIDFVGNQGQSVATSLNVGRVTNGNTWGGVSGTQPVYAWAGTATQTSVLINNVVTQAAGEASVDVTAIVRDWVNGIHENNGFALSLDPVVQIAGYNSPQLRVVLPVALIPEPGSVLLVFAGIFGLGLSSARRRTC